MDLGHACHRVKDEIMLHNEMCEARNDEGLYGWAATVGGVGTLNPKP